MIRLGALLTLRGGRQALVRLLLTTFTLALVVGLMLGGLSMFHAYQATSNRPCWECTKGTFVTGRGVPAAADGKQLWSFSQDFHQGREIRRLDVAALSANASHIPGMTKVPPPGEYYASPALAALLATAPPGRLGDRFPGRQAGLIGDAALTGPDELVIVIGRTPAELVARPAAMVVGTVATSPEPAESGIVTGNIYPFAFELGSVALLLLPLMILVGTATRLSVARRQERYAAMRLVGATPGQIAVIASVEPVIGSVFGSVLGVLGYLAVSTQVAKVSVTGTRFFPTVVTPTVLGYLGALVVVPVASAAAALWVLRRVRYDPLGVSRKARSAGWAASTWPPVVATLVEWLPIGFLLFACLLLLFQSNPDSWNAYAGFDPWLLGMPMLWIVQVGPWVTKQTARLLSRVGRGASSMLAARRMADNPRFVSRTVSGLIVAVFVGTAIAGFLPSAITAGTSGARAPLSDVLRVRYDQDSPTGNPGPSPAAAAQIIDALRAIPGVWVIPIYREKQTSTRVPGSGRPPPAGQHPPYTYIRCTDVALLPLLGSCRTGQQHAVIAADNLFVAEPLRQHLPVVNVTELAPGADSANAAQATPPTPPATLDGLNVSVLLLKAADAAGLEQARTYLAVHLPVLHTFDSPATWSTNAAGPMTFGEVAAIRGAMFRATQQIILFGVVVTLVVAGCDLIVATAGSLLERKRPFTLLRLSGTPLSCLYQVVFLESALPLLPLTVLAGASAYAIALIEQLVLTPHVSMTFPAATYFTTTGIALTVALLVTVGSMALLSRLTRTDTIRFE